MLQKRDVLLVLVLPSLLAAQVVVGTTQVQSPELTAPASTTPPEQKCVVAGRVTNSQTGEPLKKATVRLTRHTGAGGSVGFFGPAAEGYSGISETDGSFRFEGVEPGDYALMGERSGFLSTQYGAKGAFGSGQNITLQPGQQLTGLSLALIKQAVISGKVVDDDGDPEGGITIQALRQIWMRGKSRWMPMSSGQSDDQGEFRLSNLQPGKYHLLAMKMNMPRGNETPAIPGKPDVRPVRTFYPDVTTRESAVAIEVKAGQDQTGMDIHLRSSPTYHVRGKLMGQLPESDTERIMLNIGPQDEEFPMMGFGHLSNLKKDHTFDIAGIAPGAYVVSVTAFSGAVRSFTRQNIEVGSSDLNGVVLTIQPSGTIHGQVRVEGTPQAGDAGQANLAQVRVMLSPADQGQMFSLANTSAKADGSFVLENITPGNYYPQAMNGPEGTYLKSVRFGQQDVLGKELDLTQTTSADLQIVFRYGSAEIDGTVQRDEPAAAADSAAQPNSAPSASILLIPETMNADGSGMQFGSTNQNGVFSIKQVSPGRYRAVAVQQADMMQLQNPEVLKQLAAKGTDIEVRESDKKQIQLPIVPASDFQQILARLGIEE